MDYFKLSSDGVPIRLVRYFRKGRTADHHNGRFWFSTLSEFRNAEQLRFEDLGEGKIEFSVQVSGEFRKGINIPPIYKFRVPAGEKREINISGGRMILPIDFFSICFSLGPYNRSHHAEMLAKNEDLTHYVEVDTKKFLLAAVRLGLKRKLVKRPHGRLWIARIQYVDRPFHLNVTGEDHDGFDFEDIKPLATIKSTFCKPLKFEYEKEVRIAFPSPTQGMSRGFMAASHYIKQSITKEGYY